MPADCFLSGNFLVARHKRSANLEVFRSRVGESGRNWHDLGATPDLTSTYTLGVPSVGVRPSAD
jgi:hypothetical protein